LARIALDAMGGDHAPHATVAGALLALGELDPAHTIQLVGRTEVIERELAALLDGEFAHAGRCARSRAGRRCARRGRDVDRASVVLRRPNSSMALGLRLQAEGKSDAFVSAGNTGAQMAASKALLELHPGSPVRRSAPCSRPRQSGGGARLGRNVDCSAQELVQFARLGAVYAEDLLGRQNPSLGLLSVGEEAEKGNAVVKEANQLLQRAGLNFQGNVEGRDIARGASERGPLDVVVCDGFVGNVLLKFYEALAPVLLTMIAEGAGLERAQLASTFKHLDYNQYGGAPLLGVQGVSIISHGSSTPVAIKNALGVARPRGRDRDEHAHRPPARRRAPLAAAGRVTRPLAYVAGTGRAVPAP
jgi:glycerol-3-phosphate acyltransferase PlsX